MARRGVDVGDAQWAQIKRDLPRLLRSRRGGRPWVSARRERSTEREWPTQARSPDPRSRSRCRQAVPCPKWLNNSRWQQLPSRILLLLAMALRIVAN